MLGDCQTIIFLLCSLAVTPSGSRLDWDEVGTSVPYLPDIPCTKGTPVSGAMRSQLQCRMHECPCWSFTSYKGTSVMIWHTTSWDLSSHLSLIFLFPLKVSALTRMRYTKLQSYGTYFLVIVPFLSLILYHRLGLGFLKGGPQSVSDTGYVLIHTPGEGATLGDLCVP